eukprot:m.220405 g.220405  ORF g.220405 m.220405 type:complete len:80 (-) comp54145_c1_seq18:1085-1324(-)
MLAAAGAETFPPTDNSNVLLFCALAAGDVQRVDSVLAAHPRLNTMPTVRHMSSMGDDERATCMLSDALAEPMDSSDEGD